MLRWSPGPEGSTYRVTATTEDLRPVLLVQALTEARLQVPAEQLARLAAGDRLVGQGEAHWPDGSLVRSDTFIVRLR